jgi:predicted membrane-bound mannosyltransferase
VTFRAASVLIAVAAALLRFPDLADRPMHADEDVQARKLGTLLESGSWKYEPGEYHGPVMQYLTAGIAHVAGARGYRDLTETMLRATPAALGVALAAMPLAMAGVIGRAPALAIAALTALSPAMVYYSRYYIPETLLVVLTASMAMLGRRGWGVAAGVVMGLMFATKETAVIAAVALMLAARRRPGWRLVTVAAVVPVILLGPREIVWTISEYARQAVGRHLNPWHFYLGILVRQETMIAALAACGAAAAIAGRGLDEGERVFARLAAVYTLIALAIYSAIPYKTPWCLLGPLHGLIALAGLGGVAMLRLARPAGVAVIALAGAHLAWQSYIYSRPMAADPRNAYAYAHTTRDVYQIRSRIGSLAAPIQVISAQNIWPLPWYLRAFPSVEWRRAVTADMRPAPVILATPDLEESLMRHLYETMPPGERPLYVPMFDRRIELRPGFEVRAYVQQSLAAR